MGYLLIFDLKGNGAGRKRLSRHLRRAARRVQHSVWRFRDYGALRAAAECVLASGGKVLAFVESDRIPMDLKEVRQFLHGALNKTGIN